ncbi:MAG: DUF1858 domain-containing protein [Bacteroidales bacterium]|jgi:hypothetical protein|nr:DUF1858 domain-containing protein [Bacteroidales bacterium]HOL98329.1 DUF1858 domain-containing protein [Bacteroidales bacterium]HOM35733.1 DUF1858 domain-containing protein [Bacteroidales bacterium]HPD23127.1 DUF1858 domain-containing protein [Bacteroidales bacterium]HRS99056.1 DUF1858 domain-containing protein [Bacteroidales bacterium]
MENHKLIISPKTKILQLIEAYPHLEDVLIAYLPEFKKLKNPILRKTVAKIATLQQVAVVGNIKVEDLINLLRKEVGQDTIELADEVNYNTIQPDWFDEKKISTELDVREMLNAGEQPVNKVISDLNHLKIDKIYKVIAPFVPAPLIDKSLSLGFDHWIKKETEDLFIIYFKKTKE